jgi:hypothetical protein
VGLWLRVVVYLPASLCTLAGRYDNPTPELAPYHSQGLRIWLLISNGGRFKPAFAKRDKKQTMIDLRGISTNCMVKKPVMSIHKAFKTAGSESWTASNAAIGMTVTMITWISLIRKAPISD